jgi:TctA family transporter
MEFTHGIARATWKTENGNPMSSYGSFGYVFLLVLCIFVNKLLRIKTRWLCRYMFSHIVDGVVQPNHAVKEVCQVLAKSRALQFLFQLCDRTCIVIGSLIGSLKEQLIQDQNAIAQLIFFLTHRRRRFSTESRS